MPYFDVFLNNGKILCAGGSDLTLIEVTLITSSPIGMPQLHVHGMCKDVDNIEYLEWLNRQVAFNDIIKVEFFDTSEAIATISPIREKMKKLKIKDFLSYKGEKGPTSSLKTTIDSSQYAQIGHRILFDDSRRFSTTVTGEATTQLSATWHSTNRKCKIEVANLSEHEGEMWMETYLSINHWFEVEVWREWKTGTDLDL